MEKGAGGGCDRTAHPAGPDGMDQNDPHAEGAAAVAAAWEALQALCQELNLDERSVAQALDDFTAIRGNYSREREVIHWLACLLYAACRKSISPTVGKGSMEGNCMSLTRILRSAKLRVHHEKRWAGRNTSWNQDCREKYQ